MNRLVCLAWVLTAGIGCTSNKPAKRTGPAPVTLPALHSIEYHRTGGFSGVELRLIIGEDRSYIATSSDHFTQGKLEREQVDALTEMFDGWELLHDAYLEPPDLADDFQITIRYGMKTVTASDMSADLPAIFRRAHQVLGALAEKLLASGETRRSP